MLIAARPVKIFGRVYAQNEPVRDSRVRGALVDKLIRTRFLMMNDAPLPPQAEALHILAEPAIAADARAVAEDPLERAKRGEVRALTDDIKKERPKGR